MSRTPPIIRPIDGEDGCYVRRANALQSAIISDLSMGLEKATRVEQTRVMAQISAMLVCDENGHPLFETADQLLEESPEFLAACAEAALAVNDITGEEQEKNSEAGRT